VALTKHYAMKTNGGGGCTDPRFLDRGSSWRGMASFTTLPLYPPYPLNRRWASPRAGLDDMEKGKLLTLPGLELRLLDSPARSQSLCVYTTQYHSNEIKGPYVFRGVHVSDLSGRVAPRGIIDAVAALASFGTAFTFPQCTLVCPPPPQSMCCGKLTFGSWGDMHCEGAGMRVPSGAHW
jgi:hypothetical protein